MVDVVWEPSDVWDIHRKPILELVSDLLFILRKIIQDRQNIDPVVQCLHKVPVGGSRRRPFIQAVLRPLRPLL